MNFTQPKNVYSVAGIVIPSLQSTNKSYSFKSSHTSTLNSKDNVASMLIESYFFSLKKNMGSLLYSAPTYSHTSNKVTIHIFYYNNEKYSNKEKPIQNSLSEIQLSSLSNSLVSIYKKEVSVVFTRVHYPYLNSSIFSKYLAHNAPSNTFIHFQDSIITYPSRNASNLPSYISGIKIELAGRLLTEPVVPRITKKVTLFGSFSGLVDYAKYTTKNELGAFTIKV
jgi:hypothetical protein